MGVGFGVHCGSRILPGAAIFPGPPRPGHAGCSIDSLRSGSYARSCLGLRKRSIGFVEQAQLSAHR